MNTATILIVAALAAATPFAPDVVSTQAIEDAGTFAPEGSRLVFSRREGRWGGTTGPSSLYVTQLVDGEWSEPVVLPFSGHYDDGDPFFSPDGQALYFTSDRPTGPDGQHSDTRNIWIVRPIVGGWAEPEYLGDVVNSDAREFSPVVTADGTLYFASMREGGYGQGDIYRARRDGGGFASPENLGPAINTADGEWNVYVAADESYLIFEASGRPTNRSPSGDLYISYQGSNGWRPPVALTTINTNESELNARPTPDARSLLFARSLREHTGHRHANLFTVDLQAVLPHLADRENARVLAVARSAHEMWMLETGTWRPLHRIPVGRGPHEVAVSEDGAFAYTADYGTYLDRGRFVEEAGGTITEVDLAQAAVARVIALNDCARNHGILVSVDGAHLWTTCEDEGTVLQLDRISGTRVRVWPTARGSHQLAAALDGAVIVAANVESGSVSLIYHDDDRVVTLPTGRGAEGLAVAPDGATVWVGNTQDNTISVVDVREAKLLDTFSSGGRFPVKLGFTPDGRTLWVVNTFSRSLVAFDARTRTLKRSYEFETTPLGLLLLPDSEAALLTFPRRNEVAVIDLESGEIVTVIPGVIEADGLAWVR